MKPKQAEMMEIDLDEVPPGTPPRMNKTDEKEVIGTGETAEKAIECGLTPDCPAKTLQNEKTRKESFSTEEEIGAKD